MSEFYDICTTGDIDAANNYIQKNPNADWNYALRGACYSGHKELILLAISNGADDWTWGLLNTKNGGHIELSLLMVQKGANMSNILLEVDYIYYFFQSGIPRERFGSYKKLYDCCVRYHEQFYNIIFQILGIEDLAKIAVSF